jgi:Rps23 Pro-64 3,4-dihydroxylase Tpa1-like proline 4-hydroxylase
MERLAARASRLREEYAAAVPFPHAYVDGMFPKIIFNAIRNEFQEPVGGIASNLFGQWAHCALARLKGWRCIFKEDAGFLKVANMNERTMGPHLQGVLNAMKTPAFVSYLEHLTGISPLIVDRTNEGSGQHQILRGGSLQIHADFNELHISNEPLLHRRVNAFLYLNEDWETAWGGDLEMWHRNMTTCAGRIAPLANRLVVFTTTDFSYHGHADPLECPPHRSRRSIAVYYYSMHPADRRERLVDDKGNPVPHSTLYQTRKCRSCLLDQCRRPVATGSNHSEGY